MTNRFKGSNVDRQSVWRTMNRGSRHCTGSTDQDHSQEEQMQRGKMVIWGGLTNSWEKKRSKRQRRKGKMLPIWMLNAEFQWITRRDEKAFLSKQCKEIEENNRMESLQGKRYQVWRYQGNISFFFFLNFFFIYIYIFLICSDFCQTLE